MPKHPPVYLDNHATTRCHPRVVEALLPYLTEDYGNAASRAHRFGTRARSAVERARVQVAGLVGASPKEVVWTSGATESDNLAITGVLRAHRGRHLVTVATEHKAVLDTCAAAERAGTAVTVLGVGADGRIDLDELAASLRPDTALVSIMAVNNEIGVVQPLAEIGALCRAREIPWHCDAAQAAHVLPLDVRALGIDLLSLSAHKMYGPKGIGALVVRRGRPRLKVAPLLHGGGHERGMRSGTLPVPLIVGMGEACALAGASLHDGTVERVAALRDRLYAGLLDGIEGVHLNGSEVHRSAANLNVSFDDVEAEALIMALRDIAVSTGSACSSATLEPSYVLRALGVDADRAARSVRFGLSRFTTGDEVDTTIAAVREAVAHLRELVGLYEPL